jgi:hypothetical protein
MNKIKKLTALMSVLALSSVASYGITVGADLKSRAIVDTANGASFVLVSPFTSGGTLNSWSIFNDNGKAQWGNSITPLLIEALGGDYIVRGIGTSRTNDGSGLQNWSFGLAAGSASITNNNFFFGWKDGTASTHNTGSIELDFVGSLPSTGTQNYFGAQILAGGTNLGAGTNLGPGINQQYRDYSVQATAPDTGATLALLGLSMIGLVGLRRKMRS